jgi:hypothetical protein
MKPIYFFLRSLAVLSCLLLISSFCIEEVQAESVIISLAGDKDGFGIGLKCGNQYSNINHFTATEEDLIGTDVPMFMSSYIGPLPNPFGPDALIPPVHREDISRTCGVFCTHRKVK